MKRDRIDMEIDTQRILKAARTASNLEELSQKTGLSKHQISNTLKNNPDGRQAVRESLKSNRKALVEREEEENKSLYCIDASITSEYDWWMHFFDDLFEKGKQVVFTTITVDEVEKLQSKAREAGADDDKRWQGMCARRLLLRAAKEEKHFKIVKLMKDAPYADNCIIDYCARNKADMALVTADKGMTLRARAEDVKTIFVEKRFFETSRDESFFADRLKKMHIAEEEKTQEKKNTTEVVAKKAKKEEKDVTQAKKVKTHDNKEISPQAIQNDVSHEVGQVIDTLLREEETPIPCDVKEEERKTTRGKKERHTIPGTTYRAGHLMIEDKEFDTPKRLLGVFDKWERSTFIGPRELYYGENVIVLFSTANHQHVILRHYKVVALSEKNNGEIIFDKLVDFTNPKSQKNLPSMYKQILKMHARNEKYYQ